MPTQIDLDATGSKLNFDSNTFVIDESTNRVGIGTNTPDELLDIESSGNAYLYLKGSGTGYTGAGIKLEATNGSTRPSGMYMYNSESDNCWYSGRRYGGGEAWGVARASGTGSDFEDTADQSNFLMAIDSSGNVGIGTTEPTSPLHVTADNSNAYTAKIINTNNSNSSYLMIRSDATQTCGINFNDGSTRGYIIMNTSEDMIFYSGGGATSNVNFRVMNNGVIRMENLPTSSEGLSAGDLWNNSGVVNIV